MFILGIVALTLAIVAAFFGKFALACFIILLNNNFSLAVMEYREAREAAQKRKFRKAYYKDMPNE